MYMPNSLGLYISCVYTLVPQVGLMGARDGQNIDGFKNFYGLKHKILL